MATIKRSANGTINSNYYLRRAHCLRNQAIRRHLSRWIRSSARKGR